MNKATITIYKLLSGPQPHSSKQRGGDTRKRGQIRARRSHPKSSHFSYPLFFLSLLLLSPSLLFLSFHNKQGESKSPISKHNNNQLESKENRSLLTNQTKPEDHRTSSIISKVTSNLAFSLRFLRLRIARRRKLIAQCL